MEEIAAYLNRDLRTVKRWERSRGLPVHRLPGGPKPAVYAMKSELDAWRRGAAENDVLPGGVSTNRNRRALRWPVLGFAALTAAGLVFWMVPQHPKPIPRVTLLTSYHGVEWFPAFSPDGRQVAFSWNGREERNYDIYAKLLDAGDPLRLTTDRGMDLAPVWSPDGRYIAFMRWRLGAPVFEYTVVPSLGGAERRITEGTITPNAIGIPFPVLAWTPDSRSVIILGEPSAEGRPYALKAVSVETGASRVVTQPPEASPGDCCPVLSPDGSMLAFLRASSARTRTPFVLNIARDGEPSGAPRPLGIPSCRSPMWSGDSSELLCVADGADGVIWRVPVLENRAAVRLVLPGVLGEHFTMSPRGDRLIYSNFAWEGDIWELKVDGSSSPVRVVDSSANDLAPQYSPDETRIAFLSARSGRLSLWISDRTGARARRLVPVPSPLAPAWSPDGKEIAYTCRTGAKTEDICAIRPDGGAPRQLTDNPARDILPSWSRDGGWVYFASDRSGSFQTWKTPAATPGPAIQVTRGGGFRGIESQDGRWVYYAKMPLSGPIWQVPAQGGQESPVAAGVASLRLPQNFAVGGDGIYYAFSPDPMRRFEVRFHAFRGGTTKIIGSFESGLGNGMSLSPDGHTLLVSTSELRSGDLIQVEHLFGFQH